MLRKSAAESPNCDGIYTSQYKWNTFYCLRGQSVQQIQDSTKKIYQWKTDYVLIPSVSSEFLSDEIRQTHFSSSKSERSNEEIYAIRDLILSVLNSDLDLLGFLSEREREKANVPLIITVNRYV